MADSSVEDDDVYSHDQDAQLEMESEEPAAPRLSAHASASRAAAPSAAAIIDISDDDESDGNARAPAGPPPVPLLRANPTDPCPICLLLPPESPSYLDCYHCFCFSCILQWCNINPTCPICKAPARRVLFDVTTDLQYRVFPLDSLKSRTTAPASDFLSEAFPTEYHRRRRRLYNIGIRSKPLSQRPAFAGGDRLNEKDWARLSKWVQLELQALLEDRDVDFVLQYVRGNLLALPLGSAEQERRLVEFLDASQVPTFLRELRHFASSGMDVQGYDRISALALAAAQTQPSRPSSRK
jgi:hypothetical protein